MNATPKPGAPPLKMRSDIWATSWLPRKLAIGCCGVKKGVGRGASVSSASGLSQRKVQECNSSCLDGMDILPSPALLAWRICLLWSKCSWKELNAAWVPPSKHISEGSSPWLFREPVGAPACNVRNQWTAEHTKHEQSVKKHYMYFKTCKHCMKKNIDRSYILCVFFQPIFNICTTKKTDVAPSTTSPQCCTATSVQPHEVESNQPHQLDPAQADASLCSKNDSLFR